MSAKIDEKHIQLIRFLLSIVANPINDETGILSRNILISNRHLKCKISWAKWDRNCLKMLVNEFGQISIGMNIEYYWYCRGFLILLGLTRELQTDHWMDGSWISWFLLVLVRISCVMFGYKPRSKWAQSLRIENVVFVGGRTIKVRRGNEM